MFESVYTYTAVFHFSLFKTYLMVVLFHGVTHSFCIQCRFLSSSTKFLLVEDFF